VFGWIGMSSARSGGFDAFARFGNWALVRVRVRNVRVFDAQPTPAHYTVLYETLLSFFKAALANLRTIHINT